MIVDSTAARSMCAGVPSNSTFTDSRISRHALTTITRGQRIAHTRYGMDAELFDLESRVIDTEIDGLEMPAERVADLGHGAEAWIAGHPIDHGAEVVPAVSRQGREALDTCRA